MNHKVINLKKDRIFLNSIEYKDELDYNARMIKHYGRKINEDERETQSRRRLRSGQGSNP